MVARELVTPTCPWNGGHTRFDHNEVSVGGSTLLQAEKGLGSDAAAYRDPLDQRDAELVLGLPTGPPGGCGMWERAITRVATTICAMRLHSWMAHGDAHEAALAAGALESLATAELDQSRPQPCVRAARMRIWTTTIVVETRDTTMPARLSLRLVQEQVVSAADPGYALGRARIRGSCVTLSLPQAAAVPGAEPETRVRMRLSSAQAAELHSEACRIEPGQPGQPARVAYALIRQAVFWLDSPKGARARSIPRCGEALLALLDGYAITSRVLRSMLRGEPLPDIDA